MLIVKGHCTVKLTERVLSLFADATPIKTTAYALCNRKETTASFPPLRTSSEQSATTAVFVELIWRLRHQTRILVCFCAEKLGRQADKLFRRAWGGGGDVNVGQPAVQKEPP